MNGKIIKGHLCPYLDVQPKMLKTPKKKKKSIFNWKVRKRKCTQMSADERNQS